MPTDMHTPQWLDREQWSWTSRPLAVSDGMLHAVIEGEGETVVLVHGTPTWSFEWRHVIRALTPTHRVVAVDHLGFGLSERPPHADYSPEAHAGRFREVIDDVAPSGRLSLVVHDFGGPIALDWALDHPHRLAHLVIVNSFAWSPASDPSMRRPARLIGGRLGRLAYRHLNFSQRVIMPAAYADKRRLTPAIHRQYLNVFPNADSREQVLFALARSLSGSDSFFSSLEKRLVAQRDALSPVPTTLMWGMRDPAFGADALRRWLRLLPHAHSRRFEDAGHWPHEEQPDVFVRVLREALAR